MLAKRLKNRKVAEERERQQDLQRNDPKKLHRELEAKRIDREKELEKQKGYRPSSAKKEIKTEEQRKTPPTNEEHFQRWANTWEKAEDKFDELEFTDIQQARQEPDC